MRTPVGTPQGLLPGLRLLARAGVLEPMGPDCVAAIPLAALRHGVIPATAYAIAARRDPTRVAVVDDRGTLTFAEIHRRTDRLARAPSTAGSAPTPGRAAVPQPPWRS